MTREEFENMLEEAYIEGYNTAISDIQEDILDEEAFDLEGEYGVYCEVLTSSQKKEIHDKMNAYDKEAQNALNSKDKTSAAFHLAKNKNNRSSYLRGLVASAAHDTHSKFGTFFKKNGLSKEAENHNKAALRMGRSAKKNTDKHSDGIKKAIIKGYKFNYLKNN